MNWIFLVIIAQLISAIVVFIDKHLVSVPTIGRPVVYAFYIGILSSAVIVLLPLGIVDYPAMRLAAYSVISGISYVASIVFLYKSLKISDASDVAPVLGATGAVATLIFSSVFLGWDISGNFLYGFVLLVLGTILMSYFRLSARSIAYLLIAGILFGFSSVFLKMVFNISAFWNGFFWSRLGNVLGVLLLLAWPANAKHILASIRGSSVGTKSAIVVNKVVGGLAFLLLLYAIKLGNVSIVNAMSGVQFAFVLLFAIIFTKKFPEYFKETVHHKPIIVQKTIATFFIVFGLVFLFM